MSFRELFYNSASVTETPTARCLIIGEVAQSHDGSVGVAHAFIDAIAESGADAVKFQTHIAAAESTPDEPWRVKFSQQDATRYDYWKRMEFTEEQWHGLKKHAHEKGLRKIQGSTHKWLLRRMAGSLLPGGVVEAPKRPLQTPQREWLREPLQDWATEQIDIALSEHGGIWLNSEAVRRAWWDYLAGPTDNSFFTWEWINMGMMVSRSVVAV